MSFFQYVSTYIRYVTRILCSRSISLTCMSEFVSHPPVLSPKKIRPSSSSEEPHLSCDPICMLSTCEMQTIIPLALRGAAPAHLILAHTSRTAAPDTTVFFFSSPSSFVWIWGEYHWRCGSALKAGEEVGTSYGDQWCSPG